MSKYFKLFFVVLTISTCIVSCKKDELEMLSDLKVIEKYKTSVLLTWEGVWQRQYGSSLNGVSTQEMGICISTLQNPTTTNAIVVSLANPYGTPYSCICYNKNGYHVHDYYTEGSGCDGYECYFFPFNGNLAEVDGLISNATYYVRAYAIVISREGTATSIYSKQVSFRTLE